MRDLLFEHDLEQLRRNFERHVSREVAGPPTAEAVAEALEWVHGAFAGTGIDWWLAGSGALLARGLDVGCRVDVAFEPEAWVDEHGPVDLGPAAARALETITWRDRTIRVPPLAYHLCPNRAHARHAVVEVIEERLADG